MRDCAYIFLSLLLCCICGGMLLKRAMGNAQWAMGNGQWAMGNGQWAMGNGQWGIGNGKLKMGKYKKKLNKLKIGKKQEIVILYK